MNRSYEIFITAAVCRRLFGQNLHDDAGDMAQTKFACESVISNIADRVVAGVSEPDVDNLEQIFNGPPSGNNCAGSSPST